MQVGRRRTSDGPTRVAPIGRMPLRGRESIEEDEKMPRQDPRRERGKIPVAVPTWPPKRPQGKALGATGGDRGRFFVRATPGKGRLIRMLIGNEQPRSRMPKPAKPQNPEGFIEEALAQWPTFYSVGPQMIPPREAANFPSKPQY